MPAAGGYVGWRYVLRPPPLPAGIGTGKGHTEAEQSDEATRIPARVVEVLTVEPQMVAAGAILARLDAASIETQVHEAEQAKLAADAETPARPNCHGSGPPRARPDLQLARRRLHHR